MATSPPIATHALARQARERFVLALDAAVPDLAGKMQAALAEQAETGRFASAEQAREALDAADAFRRERAQWAADVSRRWRDAAGKGTDGSGGASVTGLGGLSLVDDEEIERKIIASRLGTAVMDAAGTHFNDLRLRIQALERGQDLPAKDVLRPETLAQMLVQAWTERGMPRAMFASLHGEVAGVLTARMVAAYKDINQWLVQQGVEAHIDMRRRVRRADEGNAFSSQISSQLSSRPGPFAASRPADSVPVPEHMAPGPAYQDRFSHGAPGGMSHAFRGGGHGQAMAAGQAHGGGAAAHSSPMTQTPYVRPSALAWAEQETRMVTGMSPMARMRQRAQGVLGQLRRLVSDRVADFGQAGPSSTRPLSPQLNQALTEQATLFAVTEWMERPSMPGVAGGAPQPVRVAPTPAQVQDIAVQLRQRASVLKAKADKPSEKATIEIVAQMFQAILAEERIPAAIRVWFARLQIPVLRLALAEPDFFASVQHPARQLIDRMGACVLGFDASQVAGSRLEREIKRIVQVIEQYPETGRRVYQLVLDEFKKFLGRSLTESWGVQQAATLAQQVEQEETLSIQYTIELRRMLGHLPAPEDVREFLFRVWSRVLALSAVRRGPQHAETLRFKQAAADLLWAVSPKPDRAERTRVVRQLSGLLGSLREGMGLLGMGADEQDGHVKLINAAVTQAFVSRDEGMPQHKLDELAQGLAGLEDVITDDPEGDMLLDPGMIELMSGVEGSGLEVIATGGSQPTEGMLHWARELEVGTWFSLDYQGHVAQVQYVWRSARGQLHLLSGGVGHSFLVQTRRLAAYLQAGLLVPVEDEALTARATREALVRLGSHPEHLLQ
ncbi:MAG: DUF1631 family protein [Pseudomonadota bacterium]|nr:DUF1631 family protein [Pseudomonadota bacterium]